MDAVYTCRHGANEELRYSLRSLENLEGVDRVWVVGGAPEWYTGHFIHVAPMLNKYDTVRNNLHAILDSDVSETFVLMNDDFFVTKKTPPLSLVEGLLLHRMQRFEHAQPNGRYTRELEITYKFLLKQVGYPLSFELHTPMVMHKEGLRQVLKMPGLWRSVYGNLFVHEWELFDDVKLYGGDPWHPHTPFLSTTDGSFKLHQDKFELLFSTPSRFESLTNP
jgi:hypothetical protein